MEQQNIDRRARVWVVVRGPDGRMQEQLDPEYLASLDPAEAAEIEDALIVAAGKTEVAQTRVW